MTASGPVRVGHLSLGAIHNRIGVIRSVAADPRVDLTVIYDSQAGVKSMEFGYGRGVVWDTDLLSGYRHHFLERSDTDREFTTLGIFDPDVVGVVARARFDVLWIHAYAYATHMLAAMTQRARGGAVLLRETQTRIDEQPGGAARAKAAVKRGLIGATYGRGAHGAYVGTESRRWFERYVAPAERLTFTPNEIDVEPLKARVEELRRDLPATRESLGLPADPGPVILWVGRFAEMKQPLALLEAFARVRAKRPCALLMAGSGPLEDEVRAAIERDGLQDVYLTGFLNRGEIPAAYAAADLMTLPSAFGETFGFVVIEALASGLPVVVSDAVGASTDLVRDGENGYIVPRRDVDALSARLEALVADSALRQEMAGRAPASVSEWTPRQTSEGMLEAIAASVGSERWAAAASGR